MAIDKNVFVGTALTTFAISMIVASGPYGLAFGAALIWSSLIALALTAVIYGALEGNNNMKRGPHVPTPVTTHTQTFVPKPAPVVVRTPAAVVHTQHFEPALPTVVVPPVRTPAAVVHTQQFVPAQTQVRSSAAPVSQTHTRHFEPAAKPAATIHTQRFVPAGAGAPITPAAAAAANAARAARHQAPPAAHPPGVKVSSVFVPRK